MTATSTFSYIKHYMEIKLWFFQNVQFLFAFQTNENACFGHFETKSEKEENLKKILYLKGFLWKRDNCKKNTSNRIIFYHSFFNSLNFKIIRLRHFKKISQKVFKNLTCVLFNQPDLFVCFKSENFLIFYLNITQRCFREFNWLIT